MCSCEGVDRCVQVKEWIGVFRRRSGSMCSGEGVDRCVQVKEWIDVFR